eukprot:m.553809 g.553809  ORF g.553809 m.553809 type:complete len:110 (+) comp22172_c1_seq16:867-1196(+)
MEYDATVSLIPCVEHGCGVHNSSNHVSSFHVCFIVDDTVGWKIFTLIVSLLDVRDERTDLNVPMACGCNRLSAEGSDSGKISPTKKKKKKGFALPVTGESGALNEKRMC